MNMVIRIKIHSTVIQSKQVGGVISDPFDPCVDIEWIFEGA